MYKLPRSQQLASFFAGALLLAAEAVYASGPPPSKDIQLPDKELKRISETVSFPMGLSIHAISARMFPGGTTIATIESSTHAETDSYRRFFQTTCEIVSDEWKCKPISDIMHILDGNRIEVGFDVSTNEVLEVVALLPSIQSYGSPVNLKALKKIQNGYWMEVMVIGCIYYPQLRRDGKRLVILPGWQNGLRVC